MKNISFAAARATALAALLVATPALALEAGASARLDVDARLQARGASSTIEARQEARAEMRAEKMGEREQKAKDRAHQEIDRRIKMLTELGAKVQGMLKVSDDGKASVDAMVQAQVAALTDLRSRIDTDDSTTTLKADMQSITKSYRIFALVIPQGHIKIAADKIHTTIDSMTALITKLTARLAEAKTTGKDTAAQDAAIVSAQTQLTAAGVAADAAVALTANLQPDNGDKTVADANKKALQDARAKIQEGLKALDTARKDLRSVVTGIKGFKLNAEATTTVQ